MLIFHTGIDIIGTGIYWESGTKKVAKGFATWKIRHTTGETYGCDREFEHKRQTNVCNSADVEDSPHNDNRLGSRGLGRDGCSLSSGGLGREG